MVRTFCLLAPVALLLSSLSPACAAGVKIGDKAPPWSGIIGIDDKEHSLADLKQAKAVVLVFTCNHCPVAQAYEDRLVALQRDYRDKGVRLVAVNVNNLDADKLGPMKVRAKEKQFNFPYLYDPTQKMGRDYGATKTPEIFVLDGERKIGEDPAPETGSGCDPGRQGAAQGGSARLRLHDQIRQLG